MLSKNRNNPQLCKQYQESISKLQADCKMKIAQVDNSEDDDACLGMKIARIEQYEPCEKKLPFFDDIDGIKKYLKTYFIDPFAREWGIKGIEDLEDGDGEEDDSENEE